MLDPQGRAIVGEAQFAVTCELYQPYIRDERGTRAQITVMPPAAYEPEPVITNAYDRQVRQDLDGSRGATGATSAPPLTTPFISPGTV